MKQSQKFGELVEQGRQLFDSAYLSAHGLTEMTDQDLKRTERSPYLALLGEEGHAQRVREEAFFAMARLAIKGRDAYAVEFAFAKMQGG